MCNFIPGEAIAIGPIRLLAELGSGLPGEVQELQPLVSNNLDNLEDSAIQQLGSLILRTDPGLELYAISQLSARLSNAIERKEAVVDLNHILPLGSDTPLVQDSLRFSPYAENEVANIRRLLRSAFSRVSGLTPRIAVLDSGLSATFIGHRQIKYFDYSNAGKLNVTAERVDPLGHGTRVVHILDQLLPPEVELWVGRVPGDAQSLTALTIARALGDIVVRGLPSVVNLSLTPRNDWFFCPQCRKRIPAPTFLSTFLPLIIRMAGKSAAKTITVMAAGNAGQIPNSRWLTEDVETLLFAVAENRKGERTRYSGSPDGPHADLFSASAFGGDDEGDAESQGVFMDGTRGTSFSAPFISAMALISKDIHQPMTKGFPSHVGDITRKLIKTAQSGRQVFFGPNEPE